MKVWVELESMEEELREIETKVFFDIVWVELESMEEFNKLVHIFYANFTVWVELESMEVTVETEEGQVFTETRLSRTREYGSMVWAT